MSAARPDARSNSAATWGVRSSGGRSIPPVTVSRTRASRGTSCVMAEVTRAASAIVGILTSTTASAASATTLLRLPPLKRPTFTVTPVAEVGELGEPRDLPGQLVDGAGAAGRVDAGVGGDAGGADAEVADALARGLERAPRQRRLEHQHRAAASGLGFDECA